MEEVVGLIGPAAAGNLFCVLGTSVDRASFFPWMHCVSLVILDMLA